MDGENGGNTLNNEQGRVELLVSILKKFESDSNLRKKIVLIPLAVVLIVTILEIWTVNRLSTYGEQISKIESDGASLRLENQLLENEIAKKSSLVEVEKLSAENGFAKVKNIEFVSETSLALNSGR